MSKDIAELLQALRKPFEFDDERYAAIEELTAIGIQDMDVLLQILQSPAPDDDPEDLIRGQIAEILGGIGDESVFEPLVEAAGSKSAFLQEKAIRALGKLGDKRAIGLLVAHLRNHWNLEMREEAAWALANYSEGWVIRVLVGAFSDQSQIVRDAATFALTQIGEASRGELLKASHSPTEAVRKQALETLTELDKNT